MVAAATTMTSPPDYTFPETLDASGNTTSWVYVGNYKQHIIQFTNPTQTALTVKAEGSLDGTYFFGIDPSGNNANPDVSGNISYTNAGATYIIVLKEIPLNYVRLKLVSYSGGLTKAGITPIKYRGG